MKLFRIIIGSLFFSILLFSCKNESKNSETSSSTPALDISGEVDKAELSKTRTKQVNSLMAKMMVTPELSEFTSMIVSVELADLMLNSEGPITVFAPTNDAFENIPQAIKQDLSNPDFKGVLTTLIKNHIIEEDLTSSSLLQSIQKNGEYSIKTMGGASLTAYLNDGEIMVKDSNGVTAKIGKSDILGTNGKLHMLDAVLSMIK
jgi:uncharacterized surface protein with fasciclin (FAS1) repeats